MIQQGFYIRETTPAPWWFMIYYNVATDDDRQKVYGALLAAGASRDRAQKAVEILRANPNTAYIFSDTDNKTTIIAMSDVTSKVELFNSVTHELQHATAHICGAFGIPYDGEQAGYIQGEIGEKLYEGVVISICPQCNNAAKLTRRNFAF